ncbi:hypothetical protein EVAR_62973_1 [Eumeta japonica]|uniref:Uncharacterized protein n=1 Tax=Eumeta variegata TaxID=151549 RepID=A0A4C1ZE22_EUMVA|nr:hypothetical protein EVAR_62973_1 [Eumeta japonica]
MNQNSTILPATIAEFRYPPFDSTIRPFVSRCGAGAAATTVGIAATLQHWVFGALILYRWRGQQTRPDTRANGKATRGSSSARRRHVAGCITAPHPPDVTVTRFFLS